MTVLFSPAIFEILLAVAPGTPLTGSIVILFLQISLSVSPSCNDSWVFEAKEVDVVSVRELVEQDIFEPAVLVVPCVDDLPVLHDDTADPSARQSISWEPGGPFVGIILAANISLRCLEELLESEEAVLLKDLDDIPVQFLRAPLVAA